MTTWLLNGNMDAMEHKDEADDALSGIPEPPGVPEPPRIAVKLPPHGGAARPGSVRPGGYQKLAIASTAASSFVTPVIVLGLGGYYLDQRLHHQTSWFAFAGTMLGFVVGVMALLRIIGRLSKP